MEFQNERVMGIDLGTKMGWSVWDGSQARFGTQVLLSDEGITAMRKTGVHRDQDPRALTMREFLLDKISRHRIELIVFEDVEFGRTLGQVQLWSTFRGVLWTLGIRCVGVPVSTLKKYATGFGSAKKERMIAAAWKNRLGLKMSPEGKIDDNSMDAFHLMCYGLEHAIR